MRPMKKRRKRWLGSVSLLLLVMILVFVAYKQQWLWPNEEQLGPNDHYIASDEEHDPHHLPQDDPDSDDRQVEREQERDGVESVVDAVGSEVDPESDEVGSVEDDSRREDGDSSPEGGLYELAELPDEDIMLVYSEMTDGVVLRIGETEYYYDWSPGFSPRDIQPQMHVADLDDDGEEELAVIIPIGSGTGISVDRLHVVDLSNGQANTFADYIEQLHGMTTFTTSMSDGQLIGELTMGAAVYPLNLATLQQAPFGEISDEMIYGNIENFSYENNTLTARIGVALQSSHSDAPFYIGLVHAHVRYDGGQFVMENVMFEVGDEFALEGT